MWIYQLLVLAAEQQGRCGDDVPVVDALRTEGLDLLLHHPLRKVVTLGR
jgi:hypothetical protein